MTKDVKDMSDEELKEYEESLDKTIKVNSIKDKQKLIEESEKKEKDLQEETDKQNKEDKLAELKIEAEEAFYNEHPEYKPRSKIPPTGEKKDNESNPLRDYYNGYFERNTKVITNSNKEVDLVKGATDLKFQVYKNQSWGLASFGDMFENTYSDDGCKDLVGEWSPDDVYAKVVWNTAVCKADLLKLCVKGLAINPGDGLGVQIRAFGQFSDPVELNSCECGSCVSITRTTYPLTLKQYNLEAIVCEKDIWDVGSILMDSTVEAMADSWAAWFDYQIYNELYTATPGFDQTLSAALSCTPTSDPTCCDDHSLMDLYHAINLASANMRSGTNPYKPDWLIISPTISEIFKRMQHASPILLPGDVHFDSDGNLTKIAGLKVVEYCRATACTAGSGVTIAILIDSRRAVGCVFGERPKMYKFFQSNCNSYRIDWWAFAAFGELDTNAIVHIVNP